ncbi:deoxyribose-phosphate aldolase [Spiroplasma endosymbiont of Megaselia nigra]|uniref:deoxyribose-phosphate aldolase n=1 Tax=Spiroplasma endosymbiont of Megaselia nigra TaxID=2478537 RepID=UPI000F8719D8|nr:deoxyribose-phosphate aldolase [Spiroplasma endosymbiont of Megaselia nigra]RUO86592.1 deoxyribose-phosphate aldolase [Spiroplasma endosymbiont of Megaselia nigra]
MKLNKYIDHTLLKPDATIVEIKKLCAEAKEYDFASVCINPTYVQLAHNLLQNTTVNVCVVVGFTLGANATITKVTEISTALAEGATEIDMVMNISKFKSNNYDLVRADMAACKKAAGQHIVKVILETCLLSDTEIIKACQLAEEAGLDFVKTSTGFSKAGATIANVKLMKKTVGERMQVKAAGGVRTKDDALAMITAGATRIGTSGGVNIMKNKPHRTDY